MGNRNLVNLRSLSAKGVINDRVKFSVGDIMLKQSKFTFIIIIKIYRKMNLLFSIFIMNMLIMKIIILKIIGDFKEFKRIFRTTCIITLNK